MTVALRWIQHTVAGAGVCRARAVLVVVALVATLLGVASPASLARAADTPASRFVWDQVSVTLRLQQDGTVRVREHLAVRFTGGPFRQGFREIPLAYIEKIDQVSVTEVGSGPAQPYTFVRPGAFVPFAPRTYTYQQVGTDLRIDWSFPPTVSKTRAFVIEYTAHGVVQVYADAQPPYQEIAWTGVDRSLTADAPVNRATLIFILPRPVDPRDTVARGNGTPYGGEDGQVWFWRADRLGRGESLEASLQFPPLVAASKPSWQDTRIRQIVRDARVSLVLLGLALLTAVGGGVGLLAAWWTRGRDPVVGDVPEFLTAPPDDTPPAVVGALLDEQVDQRDFVATLVDLGRRGVVGITEQVQPEVSMERRVAVTLLEPSAPLAPFELTLLPALFANAWRRQAQVHLPLRERAGMGEALAEVESLLYSELVGRGYFASRPPRTRAGWRFGSVGLAMVAAIILVIGVSIPSITMWAFLASVVPIGLAVAMYVLAQHMPQKTRAGAEAAARWRAFQRYMAAIDLVDVRDRAQEGFERDLPYAVAFGIERPWISAFARTGTAAPSWYDTVNLDGAWMRAGGRAHAGVPLPDLDLPQVGGLQGVSTLTANSLQSTSGALFDLFNVASASFDPVQVARNAPLSDGQLALKLGLSVISIAAGGRGSGGGRGGFS